MTAAQLFPTPPPDEVPIGPARRQPSAAARTRSDRLPAPAAKRREGGGRRHDERGEGVISAAIAVLIMAFLGVGMWVAFNTTFQHTAKNVDNKVNSCIGQTNPNC